MHFKSELTLLNIVGHVIIWGILTLITLGLALFVYPYYLNRFIINKTNIIDQNNQKIGRLTCSIDFTSIIGYVILWAVISIITLGIGYIFFVYKILAHCFNHTEVEYYNKKSDNSELPDSIIK